MHYLALDKEWFAKHQKLLLRLLRFKPFRKVLRIETEKRIVQILPNCYTVYLGKKGKKYELQTDFRTHWKYSKRLYFAFRPLWWAMHIWDFLADFAIPKMSFGFSTLTAFPDDGNPGTTSVDGEIEASSATWAGVRSAASGTANNTLANSYVAKATKNSPTDWVIRRGFFLFDTSLLTSGATISGAVFSLNASGFGTSENADSFSINIVASTPASSTSITGSDFPNVGTTVFSTLSYLSWADTAGTYNDFTLDSNGRANVDKTGVSKFAVRISLDTANTTPTGANAFGCRYADTAGTSTDPKLVVTYSVATGSKLLALLGVG